ncbi:MAG: hypothetical protein CMM02_09500 [Rhodopirellula sp.]|jgi:hypothetical protein|nr:hypothetical protein [Rhodopirellula sp.]
MLNQFSDSELSAYLEEDLEAVRASKLEEALGQDTDLQERLHRIRQQLAVGEHSLGAIWRQHNLGCPSRKTLGAYLLGILPNDQSLFIKAHLEIRGCLTCQANLEDLKEQQTKNQEELTARTTRYYKSSIGQFSQYRKDH